MIIFVSDSEPTATSDQHTTLLSVHKRVRDFGIQKTWGLTPAQIALSVTTGVNVLAIIALMLGPGCVSPFSGVCE
jgi:hypothetical protein